MKIKLKSLGLPTTVCDIVARLNLGMLRTKLCFLLCIRFSITCIQHYNTYFMLCFVHEAWLFF